MYIIKNKKGGIHSKNIFGKNSCKSEISPIYEKKFLENFSENRSIYNIMKRIIRLTESDLTRIIKRVISEETKDECPDTICYQYDYDNDVCVHVKDMKSKKLIDMWYDEKRETHSWFFDLIYNDRDVLNYYNTLKKDKSGGWGEKNDIFFFRRLAIEYCKGDDSNSGEKTQSGTNSLLKYVNSNMCGKSGEDCPPV